VINLLGVFLFLDFSFWLYPSIHPSSAKWCGEALRSHFQPFTL